MVDSSSNGDTTSEKQELKQVNLPSIHKIASYELLLYVMSLLTGLAAPMNLKDLSVKNSIVHKIYSISTAVILGGLTIYTLNEKIKYAYKYFPVTVKLNEIAFQLLLTGTICFAILNITFRGPSMLNKLAKKLKYIDKQLGTVKYLRHKTVFLMIRFIIFNIAFAGIAVGTLTLWARVVEFPIWLFSIFKMYTLYLFMLLVFQIIVYADDIHLRFATINDRLMESFKHWSINDFYSHEIKKIINDVYPTGFGSVGIRNVTVKELRILHCLLCDVMDLLNSFFGVLLFLMVPNVIVGVSILINKIFLFTSGVDDGSYRMAEPYAHYMVVVYVGSAFYIIVSIHN